MKTAPDFTLKPAVSAYIYLSI